jgi:nucleotide-binding universal stress UspA family protein
MGALFPPRTQLARLDRRAGRAGYSPTMYSTIAVGTDGSETAARAVDAAFDLAARYEARLLVLSAYSTATAPSGPHLHGSAAVSWAATEATAVERLLADVEDAAAARGIECASAMAEGDPAEVLVGLAERHGVDLLVVGNKGMHRRVLGSVPNTVTHRAPCSVFVVQTT